MVQCSDRSRYHLLFYQQRPSRLDYHIRGNYREFAGHFEESWLISYTQAVVSVALFIPSFVSPWLSTPVKDFVLFIDIIFSYLYGCYSGREHYKRLT